MPLEFFEMHSELSGLPEPSKIDTLQISYSEISSTSPDVLRRYQSQLVRFNGAHFEDGGVLNFTDGSKVTSNRTLVLADGNSIIVRTSGYSNFWNDLLPKGDGDVVGILSYYGTSGWQLLLRSRRDLLNFGSDTPALGTVENPYTVDHVIEMEATGQSGTGWVSGYIVGAVAAGTTAVTSNNDIEWTSDVSMPNTLVIANTAEVDNWMSCMVIELPQDSPLRQYGNLLDNPSNYGKQIWLKGRFEKVLSTWGLTGNNGTAAEFSIEGVDVPGGTTPGGGDEPGTVITGQGTKEAPYGVAQVITLGNPGTTSWVEGYIVGWVDGMAYESGAKFTVPATSETNFILGPTPNETDPTKCIPVQLKGGTSVRTDLNLVAHPEYLGKRIKIEGQLVAYFNKPGLKEPSAYEFVDGGTTPGGNDNPPTPPAGGTGTQEAPISVDAALAFNNSGASAWVKGVIVGWVAGTGASDAKFGAPADRTGNILIAQSAGVTDASKCMVVQLPSKSDIRSALNLMDNSGNLGKDVVIHATLGAYLGLRGLTSPTAFELK